MLWPRELLTIRHLPDSVDHVWQLCTLVCLQSLSQNCRAHFMMHQRVCVGSRCLEKQTSVHLVLDRRETGQFVDLSSTSFDSLNAAADVKQAGTTSFLLVTSNFSHPWKDGDPISHQRLPRARTKPPAQRRSLTSVLYRPPCTDTSPRKPHASYPAQRAFLAWRRAHRLPRWVRSSAGRVGSGIWAFLKLLMFFQFVFFPIVVFVLFSYT